MLEYPHKIKRIVLLTGGVGVCLLMLRSLVTMHSLGQSAGKLWTLLFSSA